MVVVCSMLILFYNLECTVVALKVESLDLFFLIKGVHVIGTSILENVLFGRVNHIYTIVYSLLQSTQTTHANDNSIAGRLNTMSLKNTSWHPEQLDFQMLATHATVQYQACQP